MILLHQNTRLPKLLCTLCARAHTHTQDSTEDPSAPADVVAGISGEDDKGEREGRDGQRRGVGGCGRDVDKSEATPLTPACTDTDPLVAAPGPHNRPMDASPSEGVPIGRSEQQKRATPEGTEIVRARCERTAVGPGGGRAFS